MRKISLGKAIAVLEQQGLKKPDILKMGVYEFVEVVNRNIGTVVSINIIDTMKKIYRQNEKEANGNGADI
jgi:hypothetical protein